MPTRLRSYGMLRAVQPGCIASPSTSAWYARPSLGGQCCLQSVGLQVLLSYLGDSGKAEYLDVPQAAEVLEAVRRMPAHDLFTYDA